MIWAKEGNNKQGRVYLPNLIHFAPFCLFTVFAFSIREFRGNAKLNHKPKAQFSSQIGGIRLGRGAI